MFYCRDVEKTEVCAAVKWVDQLSIISERVIAPVSPL